MTRWQIDWLLGYMGFVSPQTAYSAGIVQALQAIEIDNSRAETHALLGEFHKTLEYNWPEVHREMALALRLDPASPLVRLRFAVSELMPHGRLEEAIGEIERALRSDPLSLMTQGWLGVMLLLAHKWDLGVIGHGMFKRILRPRSIRQTSSNFASRLFPGRMYCEGEGRCRSHGRHIAVYSYPWQLRGPFAAMAL